MKKILFVLFGTMIMLGLSLTGCDQNPSGEKATTKSEAEEQQKTVDQAIQHMEDLSMQAENILVEAIQGIPTARGLLRSSTLGSLGITRSAAGEETLTSEEEDAIWESLTEEEQNQILASAEIIAEEFQAIVPPVIFYKGLPEGVIETDTEVIVGTDMVFSKKSPEGLQGAYALASEYYEEGVFDSRGVASWFVPKWRSGKVNRKRYDAVVTYTYGGIKERSQIYVKTGVKTITNSTYKDTIREAMRRWEQGAGMSLKFKEDTKWTGWDNFKYNMGWYKVVKIYIHDNMKPSGQAIPGRFPWSYCRFHEGELKYKNYHTIVHELGHVLGLMHEFDRRDADDYITWKNADAKKARASWIVRLTYYKIGAFDYNSVMNYPWSYYKKGTTTFIKDASYPSSGDFASIKKMYNM